MSETLGPAEHSGALTHSASSGRPKHLPPGWLPVALVLGDAVIAAISFPVGYWITYEKAQQFRLPSQDVAAIPAVVVVYLFALTVTGQYSSWRGRTLINKLLALYSGIGLATVLMLAALELGVGQRYSAFITVPAALCSATLMTGERYVLRRYETWLRRRGIGTERVLMVGTGAASETLIRHLAMFPQYGFHIVGVASDEAPSNASFVGLPVVGRVSDLSALVEELKVDQVFLALSAGQHDRLSVLIKKCEDQHLEFKIVPDLLDLVTTRMAPNAIDGLPLVGVRRSQLRGGAVVLKRTIDIVISAVLLVLLSPLMLMVVILIKVAMPGPFMFRQERIGQYRKPFVIYKFRSMIVNAEATVGPMVASRGDSRVTRLGRILRRLSIDELPQLFNVLRGDMSLVGPRPQPTFFDQRYSREVARYQERQQVRPGLTGWAEVNDLRGAAPIVDRTWYDIYYIENWSLVLDLKCLLLTVMRMFSHRHAY